MIAKHLPTHDGAASIMVQSGRHDCYWLEPETAARTNPDLAGFGYGGCHEHVEAVSDGLRYSTKAADLIAVNDGRDFGVYLFRTKGGRYFLVRHSWPMRYDRSDPLEPIDAYAARDLWADIERKARTGCRDAAVADYAEAFPDMEVIADA